jgi:hypothetical protein
MYGEYILYNVNLLLIDVYYLFSKQRKIVDVYNTYAKLCILQYTDLQYYTPSDETKMYFFCTKNQ